MGQTSVKGVKVGGTGDEMGGGVKVREGCTIGCNWRK